MAASLTATVTFGALASGNQNLSLFDTNFTQLYSGLNNLNNFGNYYADTGSASAYVITVPTVQTFSIAAGLPFAVKAITANAGASTLQIVSGATSVTKSITTQNQTALVAGQIPSGGILWLFYDGTQFQLIGAQASLTPLIASLGTDVSLNNTANYFDGPSVAQGTSGTWYASGTVTLGDGSATNQCFLKLWDGTTVVASAQMTTPGSLVPVCASLSGYMASPAGNIRISVRASSATTGKILFNNTGNSKDSTITAVRIA